MTNVRLDQNGLPKGAVFDPTSSALHRTGVTAVDAADPQESAGIDTQGYQECRLDLDLSGSGLTGLEVQAIYWNPRLGQWFGGGRRTLTATGRHSLAAPCRGQRLFLKVTSFTGTSFSLAVDYALS